MKTFDDIRDIAIRIVDDLVDQEVIKDCVDTDDEEEFTAQDLIIFRLLESQKNEILNLYTKDKFSITDGDLIDNFIGYEVVETYEILEDFKKSMYYFYDLFFENNLDAQDCFMDFDEHYDNGKTHPENWENFIEFYNSVKV